MRAVIVSSFHYLGAVHRQRLHVTLNDCLVAGWTWELLLHLEHTPAFISAFEGAWVTTLTLLPTWFITRFVITVTCVTVTIT